MHKLLAAQSGGTRCLWSSCRGASSRRRRRSCDSSPTPSSTPTSATSPETWRSSSSSAPPSSVRSAPQPPRVERARTPPLLCSARTAPTTAGPPLPCAPVAGTHGSMRLLLIAAIAAATAGTAHILFSTDTGLVGASGIVFGFIMLSGAAEAYHEDGTLHVPLSLVLLAVFWVSKELVGVRCGGGGGPGVASRFEDVESDTQWPPNRSPHAVLRARVVAGDHGRRRERLAHVPPVRRTCWLHRGRGSPVARQQATDAGTSRRRRVSVTRGRGRADEAARVGCRCPRGV